MCIRKYVNFGLILVKHYWLDYQRKLEQQNTDKKKGILKNWLYNEEKDKMLKWGMNEWKI